MKRLIWHCAPQEVEPGPEEHMEHHVRVYMVLSAAVEKKKLRLDLSEARLDGLFVVRVVRGPISGRRWISDRLGGHSTSVEGQHAGRVGALDR
jgi:hypothetical protein